MELAAPQALPFRALTCNATGIQYHERDSGDEVRDQQKSDEGGANSDPGWELRVSTNVLKRTVTMRTVMTPKVANRETRPVARFRASQLEKSFLFNCDSAAGASTRSA